MNWVALSFRRRWGHLVYALTSELLICDNELRRRAQVIPPRSRAMTLLRAASGV